MRQVKIGRAHTAIFTQDGITRVVYHSTVVLEFDRQTIRLNSGGWLSNTTKKRINEGSELFDLGCQVYQKRGDWYVCLRDPSGNWQHDAPIAFVDHMIISRVPLAPEEAN